MRAEFKVDLKEQIKNVSIGRHIDLIELVKVTIVTKKDPGPIFKSKLLNLEG